MFSKYEIVDMFDHVFDDEEFSSMNIPDIMRTDISEINGQVLMEIELPGYDRESVSAELENGYLIIRAIKVQSIEAPYEKRNYIRRERNIGSCMRQYYVGNSISRQNIQAAMKNGVLRILIDIGGMDIEDFRRKIDQASN
ncbi:Hsp20 family protein [Anaerosporobacter faecicola]|uniref:Hsp20 family protein n=1 Tax=Anaerosporobacter faecicola TaxID=2718714 RepID=UPI001438CAF9|nr:Hsp20 family protein [Anaerosporobacter faecicola]